MNSRDNIPLHSNNDEKMNRIYSQVFKLVGVVLQLAFMGMYGVINYSIALDIIKLHYLVYQSIPLVVILTLTYGYCSLNTLFNYLAACAISPGNTSDYPELNQEHFSQILNINNCQKCRKVKPPRSHHCSICKKCVFKMDHHCPWINNCVGHFNQRYFLLFLFYTTWTLFLGSIGYLNISYNSDFDEYLNQITSLAQIVSLMCYALTFAIAIFSALNWGLAIKGYTQIEYWNKKIPSPQDSQKQVTFEHSNVIDNLNEIFGTKVVFKMFLPSFRRQPEDGINWKNCRANIFQQSLQDISNNLNPFNQSQPNNRMFNNENQKTNQFYQLQQNDNDHFQLTDDTL